MDTIEIRHRLSARQDELLNRLARVLQDLRHVDGLELDFEEQAVQRENDDVLGGLDNAIRAELAQIEHVMTRIDQSRYGICESCHRRIPDGRLHALPYATRCFTCEGKTAVRQPFTS